MRRQLASGHGFRVALVLSGAGIGSYVVAALAVAPGSDIPRHVAWFLVSFAFYLAAVGLVLGAKGGGDAVGRSAELGVILGMAVLFRLALLATTPSLSDDLYRYVWDGKVLNSGIDPYRYPPLAPELLSLRGPQWEGINHKSMATPYPPLAEALFGLVYRLAPDNLRAMQAMAVAFDLGVVVLLVAMLGKAGLDPQRVVLYAWNPLVLLQFAHSAHYDAAMILTLLGAIHLLAMGKRWLSGALLGISTLLKLVPALVAPLFLPLWGVPGTIAVGAVVVSGLFPWAGAVAALSGIASEASEARFNDSLGFLVVKALGLVVSNPEVIARTILGVLLMATSLLLTGLLWWRKAGTKELLKAVYWLLGLYLLLNAVVEPWYLTWMVPFLCFLIGSPGRTSPWVAPAVGWLLLSGLVVLTDLTYLPSLGNSLWPWVRAAEYGPLYGLLLLWACRRARRLLS